MNQTARPLDIPYEVHGFDCGYGSGFRVLSIANFLQEAAGRSASELGIGMEHLQAEGRTWMLSRIDLRVDALPAEGDRVTVRTWPAGTERLFALRDLTLLDAAGRSLIRAVYAYLVVDLAARRPLRPERVLAADMKVELPHPVADYRHSVPAAEGTELSFEPVVRPACIDHNGHANNAWLIDWLVDAVPRAERGSGLRELRVEFTNEALEGEKLEARWARGGAGVLTELRRGSDLVARAETVWG
ncbi:MAG TPA: thioesterase [Spirochaetales bacterium]|nr:thioesterase [Spirochaetales bacterium]